jgi:hypothetical protein
MERGVVIAHNGDKNQFIHFRGADGDVVLSDDMDRRLSEKMSGVSNSAEGDSPQIATLLDRFITQGAPASSLRTAILMTSLWSLDQVGDRGAESVVRSAPTPADVDWAMAASPLFNGERNNSLFKRLQILMTRAPHAGSLEELFHASNGGRMRSLAIPLEDDDVAAPGTDLDDLRRSVAESADHILSRFDWYDRLDDDRREQAQWVFAGQFLKWFFLGNMVRATATLDGRSDDSSTFGLAVGALSEPRNQLWLSRGQEFYISVSEDGQRLTGASEPTAYAEQSLGGSAMRFRLTLRPHELAYRHDDVLTVLDAAKGSTVMSIDLKNIVAAAGSDGSRWLDYRRSRRAARAPSSIPAPEDRLRTDFDMIPQAQSVIREDFADPASDNARAAASFTALLLEQVKHADSPETLAREMSALSERIGGLIREVDGERKTTRRRELTRTLGELNARRDELSVRLARAGKRLNVVIVGTEKGHIEGQQMQKLLEKVSSLAGRPLSIEVVDGPSFTAGRLEELKNKGFDDETIVLGIMTSGQTANTRYVLDALHTAWKGLRQLKKMSVDGTPPHFLMSAHMDNAYTDNVLRQSLSDSAPFKARNFVTFPRGLNWFHPLEAATVTHKATEVLTSEIAFHFLRALSRETWAADRITSTVVAKVRTMIDRREELDRQVVGLDERGNPYRRAEDGGANTLPDDIDRVLVRSQVQAFLEPVRSTLMVGLFIAATLVFHVSPGAVVLGWVPDALFQGGVSLLSFGLAAGAVLPLLWTRGLRPVVSEKHRADAWGPLFLASGVFLASLTALFLGSILTWGLDVVSPGLGGVLSLAVPGPDVSPATLASATIYILSFALASYAQRIVQGRPLLDRVVSGRVLVFAEASEHLARLAANFGRRATALRFGHVGLASIEGTTIHRATHEQAANDNGRGNIYVSSAERSSPGMTGIHKRQLGGQPYGLDVEELLSQWVHPRFGRWVSSWLRAPSVWRIGVGHQPLAEADAAFTHGYVSLHRPSHADLAEGDRHLLELQELFQDGPNRNTVLMRMMVNVAYGLSVGWLKYIPGMTSSEASRSTTQQVAPPLAESTVLGVFGLRSNETPVRVIRGGRNWESSRAVPTGGWKDSPRRRRPAIEVEPAAPLVAGHVASTQSRQLGEGEVRPAQMTQGVVTDDPVIAEKPVDEEISEATASSTGTPLIGTLGFILNAVGDGLPAPSGRWRLSLIALSSLLLTGCTPTGHDDMVLGVLFGSIALATWGWSRLTSSERSKFDARREAEEREVLVEAVLSLLGEAQPALPAKARPGIHADLRRKLAAAALPEELMTVASRSLAANQRPTIRGVLSFAYLTTRLDLSGEETRFLADVLVGPAASFDATDARRAADPLGELIRTARSGGTWVNAPAEMLTPEELPILNLSAVPDDAFVTNVLAVVAGLTEGKRALAVVRETDVAGVESLIADWARTARVELPLGWRDRLRVVSGGEAVRWRGTLPERVVVAGLLAQAGWTGASAPRAVAVISPADSPTEWSRDGLPAETTLTLILGVLNGISLRVSVAEETTDMMKGLRKILTAA